MWTVRYPPPVRTHPDTGCSPADDRHRNGDEAYLYVLEMPRTKPPEVPGPWSVRVSGLTAFPRLGDDTTAAFERLERISATAGRFIEEIVG